MGAYSKTVRNRVWTPERLAKVRTLWLAGHSARKIAVHLDVAISGDAVLGQIRRQGWDTLQRQKKQAPLPPCRAVDDIEDMPERDTSKQVADACDALLADLRAHHVAPVPVVTSERPVMMRMAPLYASMIGSPGGMCADDVTTVSSGLRSKSGACR